MRADIDIERGAELHERVKECADQHRIHHSRAYAELLEYAVGNIGEEQKRESA